MAVFRERLCLNAGTIAALTILRRIGYYKYVKFKHADELVHLSQQVPDASCLLLPQHVHHNTRGYF